MRPDGVMPFAAAVDDDAVVRTYAGDALAAVAAAEDVVLWDDDAVLACTARAVLPLRAEVDSAA